MQYLVSQYNYYAMAFDSGGLIALSVLVCAASARWYWAARHAGTLDRYYVGTFVGILPCVIAVSSNDRLAHSFIDATAGFGVIALIIVVHMVPFAPAWLAGWILGSVASRLRTATS